MRNTNRRIGAALLTAGALAIGGGFLLEGPASAQQNPDTECGTDTFVYRFNFNNNGTVSQPEPGSGTVTIIQTGPSAGTDDPTQWSWTSSEPISKIVMFGGGNTHVENEGGATSGTVTWPEQQDISHMTFCGGAASSSSRSETSSSTSSSSTSSSTTSSSTTSSATTSSVQAATTVQETSQAQTSEVLGVSVTNTPAAPAPAVAGVQQTQQPAVTALPRTGMDPGLLLMLGGSLVVSGILLLRYSTVTA